MKTTAKRTTSRSPALGPDKLFHRDLPELLKTKFGRWLVYTAEGCVAEGNDEMKMFRWCERKGLKPGEFLVARVEPDLPPAEITENWFPHLPAMVHF